jgi:23S rRNA (cytidine2498-2'-O)-methyltransferase
MPAPTPRFLYAICQAGSEPFLKEELAREAPELRFAFSRPGFVTFKHGDPEFPGFAPDFPLKSVFARAYGTSLGKVRLSGPELPAQGARDWSAEEAALGEILRHAREFGEGAPLRLQAWDRFPHLPGDEPPGFERGRWTSGLVDSLRTRAPEGFLPGGETAGEGERVLTVVAVEPGELWLGGFVKTPLRSPFPGGDPGVRLPPEAPSRAFLKIEEAIAWSGSGPGPGEHAIEIGSAPGGASYALLARGVSVTGIDPGEVSPVVERFAGPARYRHLRMPAEEVAPVALSLPAQWLLLDMNMPPERSLAAARRILELQRGSLRGLFLTLKLNQPGFAARIPDYVGEVASWGMARVRATQLPSHRREILVHALTRKSAVRGR